jgi:hypothetical protein
LKKKRLNPLPASFKYDTILQQLTNIFRQIDIFVNIIIYPYFNMSDTESDAENIEIEETNEVVEPEPEHDTVKPKKAKKVKIDRKLLEPDEADEPQDKAIEKPKKPRTAAQIAAFEKALAKRKENAQMREKLRTLEKANKPPTQAVKKAKAKAKVEEVKKQLEKFDSDSDSSSSEEEQIIVKKKKAKPKKVSKKKKKVVLYVSSSDSESSQSSEEELYPQPKKRVKRSEPIQQQEQPRDVRSMFI